MQLEYLEMREQLQAVDRVVNSYGPCSSIRSRLVERAQVQKLIDASLTDPTLMLSASSPLDEAPHGGTTDDRLSCTFDEDALWAPWRSSPPATTCATTTVDPMAIVDHQSIPTNDVQASQSASSSLASESTLGYRRWKNVFEEDLTEEEQRIIEQRVREQQAKVLYCTCTLSMHCLPSMDDTLMSIDCHRIDMQSNTLAGIVSRISAASTQYTAREGSVDSRISHRQRDQGGHSPVRQ
jgi:hypothetical protein